MINKIIIFLCILLSSLQFAYAAEEASFSAGIKKDEFFDYLETVDLTTEQRRKIIDIRKEEKDIIMPFVLDVHSKERGLEFLNSLQCDMFDFDCKRRLKEDIDQRILERNEAQRKLLQKKNYYKLRYRNILTREQNLKLKKLIEENEHKDKVLMEREARAKKQERIDKLKIWRKIPDIKEKVKLPLFKKKKNL